MSVPFIQDFIAADMRAVDAVIRNRLASDVALVREVAEYIVGSGGKRLRPALVILSAGAFGYQGKHHHQLAAVVEFIHTATLLHDDVVDGSELRRGNPTANALFGNAASVLVGDFVYSRAFQMMVEVESMRVMKVLAEAKRECDRIIGEAREQAAREASQTEIVKLAERQAAEIIEDARRQARETRLEMEDWADGILSTLEVNLDKFLTAVKRGRERLHERSQESVVAGIGPVGDQDDY